MPVFRQSFPAAPTSPAHRPSATARARLKPGIGCMFAVALGLIAATPLATAEVPAAGAPATATAPQWVPGRLLVQPRPGLSDEEFDKVLKGHGAKRVGQIPGIGVHIIQLPPTASEKAVAALLSKNPHIKFAEPDMILEPQGTANDPYFPSAWHLPKIGATTAWDSSTGSAITIAILDSGVDASHPDLAGKLVAGWNFYDNNSTTTDVYGHGTKVAGSAAAVTNNSLGVAAVAGGAKIMPIRVTDTSGMGYLSYMASGITWAADHGARVANLSFQAAGGYSTIQSAAQYMKNKGGLVTTAAGNTGTAQSFAYSDTNIVVSATDSSDNKASFSSYGNFVSVAAPGVSIYSTVKGGSYGAVSGTSFAAPVTAGVVALVMAANPSLSAGTVQNLLYSTAKDLGSAGKDTTYGYGRINAAAAVAAAKGGSGGGDTSAPTVAISAPTAGATVKGLVSVNVSASDNVGVARVDLVVNGTKLASDTSSPYGFSWDSTKVADGNATLVAYAYDAAGNYSSSTVTVKVANGSGGDTIAPVVSISNPLSGSKVSGNVSVQASATDNVGVSSLSLYIDGKLVAKAQGRNLSYTWKTQYVASGTHSLQVTATDAAGNTGSKVISVTK